MKWRSFEIERISGITKQTLRWSKDSIQQTEFATADDLFEDVVRLFAAKIRNREIAVTIVGGESLHFYGVIGQIRQVMANLVSNALDAVPGAGRVWLEATTGDGEIEIVVRDEGEGMSEETQRQLPVLSSVRKAFSGMGLVFTSQMKSWKGTAVD